MYRFSLLIASISIGLTACVSSPKINSSAYFQEKNKDTRTITVKRDAQLCVGDTVNQQKCPIIFYIDSIKSGTFYINDSANYELKAESYNFKVKNCKEESCQSCDVDLTPEKLTSRDFTLSVDSDGKPFISNDGKPLTCTAGKNLPVLATKETTVQVNLAADTLFKFNGSSLNDLLPKGKQEVLNVASLISNNFVSVSLIKLIGHTDRLGSDSYNNQLGQKRADTVRNLLIQNGVPENIISTTSAGKYRPVTNGCFDIKQQEELKTCLQPDRRVSVEITGVPK